MIPLTLIGVGVGALAPVGSYTLSVSTVFLKAPQRFAVQVSDTTMFPIAAKAGKEKKY